MQLTVIEYAGKPVKSKTTVEFRPPGGTIGRNADNQLVLPDETRQISRLQALLQTDGTRCVLRNLSSVSVVQVNDTPLACEQERPVQAGDAIRIGPYVLRADTHGETANHEDEVPRERREPAAGVQAIPTDPLALFASTADELSHAARPAAAKPIAAPAPQAPQTPQPPPPAIQAHASTREASRAGTPPGATTDRQSADALLAAFLRGAGLDKATCDWSTEQLETAGQLLALFANGTVELLSSRSILKREVKADMTVLLDRENNPLKLLPDGSAALRQMFGLPFPGFMPPASAVEDAFHDLHAHHIAMVAGMRAALIDLLTRFSPEQIDNRAGPRQWHEQMLPLARQANLWSRYASLHRDMVLAVEDDFSAVFGKAFLRAYDEEVKHYHAQRRGRGAAET
ncbi:type VI secretion system-associated FHA domain protein TagH [Trinickia fusca]|uniref:Type VI secretion system-associated FHA domain protein TagH n=1 Tax=Trinickia fusca TaxID=2419777 RepID=A0A494X1D8_9BURK|nr:type VI secretion system-associated FHA domain protein TagH [Trinickia fusca]RKP44538.1 type VI secretion system-associated FHA domain protein TagH [Trinickia fusca]